jgi:hypothetical protein
VHFDGVAWSPVNMPLGGDATLESTWGTATDLVGVGWNNATSGPAFVRLQRTRPWRCATNETACTDGFDEDCDNRTDEQDTDCP